MLPNGGDSGSGSCGDERGRGERGGSVARTSTTTTSRGRARDVVTFATVLPHEPLPIVPIATNLIPTSSSSSTTSSAAAAAVAAADPQNQEQNDKLTQYGFVHIQGAFTPKQPATNSIDGTNPDSNHPPQAKSSEQQQQHQQHLDNDSESGNVKKCMCHDITYIEQTVKANLKHLLSSSSLSLGDDIAEGLLSATVVSSPSSTTPTESTAATTTTTYNSNNNTNSNNISRIRLTTSNPYSARTIVSRLRRAGYSPQDLLVSSSSKNNSSSCPHGCGGRYSGKALQVSQVAPIITSVEEDGVNDYENETNDDVVGSGDHDGENDDEDNDGTSLRWPRAAPPKFRRLMLTLPPPPTATTATTSANITRVKGGRTKSLLSDDEKEVEMESRRRKTRFVYVENIIDRMAIAVSPSASTTTITTEAPPTNTSCNVDDEQGDVVAIVTDCLRAFLQGNESIQHSSLAALLQSSSSSTAEMLMGVVEDDIRHAFMDALRDALHRDLFSPAGSSSSSLLTPSSETIKHASHLGVEVFMKPTAGTKKKGNKHKTDIGNGSSGSNTNATRHPSGMYDHLHIGMRSHEDATKLIRLWQGTCITLMIHPPQSLLGLIALSSKTAVPLPTTTTINIQTGKLFLDYADRLLSKRMKKVVGNQSKDGIGGSSNNDIDSTNLLATGHPYSSECTSSTDNVHVPGLYLLHDYIDSADMEQVLLAALAGPHAPWAPRQYTQSGGSIKRRVQHYGYVFDYESSDVLRRDYDDNGNVNVAGEKDACRADEVKMKHSCPPLPSICPTRQMVSQMTNEDVEEYITDAVAHVKGWELLAGIIERTRRFNFASISSASSSSRHDADLVVDGDGDEDNAGHPNEQHETSAIASLKASTPNDSLHQQQFLDQHHHKQLMYPHINQLTINEYTPGQGIGSHVDTETAFDDGLLLITLGGGIVMEFREVVNDDDTTANNDEEKWGDNDTKLERRKKSVYLPPRSLVLLSGDARYKWEHMIVSRMTDTVNGKVVPRKLRVSLTLRTALTKPSKVPSGGGGRQQRQAQQVPLPIYETAVFPPRWGQLSDEDADAFAASNHTAGSVITDRSDLVTPNTESKHVHDVYDAIATQWHHTRGKRGVLWPGATHFLERLPRGSVVADIGCGDGKYFSAITAASSYVIGMDIS